PVPRLALRPAAAPRHRPGNRRRRRPDRGGRRLAPGSGIFTPGPRKALDGLVQARLLTRRQGAGTFVAARVEKNFATISSFTEDMLSRGRQPHSEWISRSEGTVMPEEALAFGFGPGTPVYRLVRIRYANGESMALEHATVPK